MMQIKMHNRMVRKLHCWFVLELQNNLIFVGTLAKDGMKYSREGDWLKVSKGFLVFMKGRMNPHEIYILDCCTVRGTVTVSQSLDRYDDGRKLWHHKMGHVSNTGLFGGDATRKSEPGEACVPEIQSRVQFSSLQHLI